MIAALDGLKPRHWQTRMRDDGVLVLAFDRADASVNAFSQDALIELDTLLERIALEPPKGVVIASAKKSGFIAGADLKEFAEFDVKGTVNDAIRRGLGEPPAADVDQAGHHSSTASGADAGATAADATPCELWTIAAEQLLTAASSDTPEMLAASARAEHLRRETERLQQRKQAIVAQLTSLSSLANSRQRASPMPLVAPVTNAVCAMMALLSCRTRCARVVFPS